MYFSETERVEIKESFPLSYHLELWGEILQLYSMLLTAISLVVLPIITYFQGWKVLLFIFVPTLLFFFSIFMRAKAKNILKKSGFYYDYESDSVTIVPQKERDDIPK